MSSGFCSGFDGINAGNYDIFRFRTIGYEAGQQAGEVSQFKTRTPGAHIGRIINRSQKLGDQRISIFSVHHGSKSIIQAIV